MLRKYFFLTTFLFFVSLIHAQFSFRDTLKFYLKKKPQFAIELDGRNSFISEKPVIIDGFRLGVDYASTLKFYGGLYWNRNKIFYSVTENPATLQEVTYNQQAKFFYISAAAEYVFYKRYPWFFAVPLQLGVGWGSLHRYELNGSKTGKEVHTFMPLESMFKVKFHVTSWLTLNAGLGLRYALFSRKLSDDFSAPIYTYGIGILPKTLLKELNID